MQRALADSLAQRETLTRAEVDWDVLSMASEKDLVALRLPKGLRRKIIDAMQREAPRRRRPAERARGVHLLDDPSEGTRVDAHEFETRSHHSYE